MPLLKVHTNAVLTADTTQQVAQELTALVSQVTGKPEQYIMVVLEKGDIYLGGAEGAAAFVDYRGIGGVNATMTSDLSAQLCFFLEKALAINPERVYITYTDVAASHWGWNGSTFG